MIRCYLSLGSNLRSPERQLRQASEKIKKLPKTRVTKISPLYFSEAVGRRAQPPYCNTVVEIETSQDPKALLTSCLAIEKEQQRVRKVRWGSRTLDIDILLYGQQTIQQHHLTIPHPRMFERDFVLKPLFSIAPLCTVQFLKSFHTDWRLDKLQVQR